MSMNAYLGTAYQSCVLGGGTQDIIPRGTEDAKLASRLASLRSILQYGHLEHPDYAEKTFAPEVDYQKYSIL